MLKSKYGQFLVFQELSFFVINCNWQVKPCRRSHICDVSLFAMESSLKSIKKVYFFSINFVSFGQRFHSRSVWILIFFVAEFLVSTGLCNNRSDSALVYNDGLGSANWKNQQVFLWVNANSFFWFIYQVVNHFYFMFTHRLIGLKLRVLNLKVKHLFYISFSKLSVFQL